MNYTQNEKIEQVTDSTMVVGHMYLAEDLSAPMQQDLDAGEFLDVLELPLEEVVTMIMDGKIADAKTQLAILKTWALLQIQGKK